MIKLVDVYDGARIRDGALEFLYRLMEQREPEVNISHRAFPTFEQHRAFVTRRPYRFWYLIDAIGHEALSAPATWAGFISATHRNEIGIVLMAEYRERGLGTHAVCALIEKHRPNLPVPGEVNGHWIANIAPGNQRSRLMFERLGFRKIQETFELNEEKTDGQDEPQTRPA